MQGYWENQAATDAMLRPGPVAGEKVLHTGDIFRTDEDGFLFFVGRKDDIIKSRGEKVAPKGGRERPLRACRRPRGGRDRRARPDPRHGDQGGDRADARGAESTSRTSSATAPSTSRTSWCREIEFREDLPKTESGKISRRLIEAEMLEATL